MTLLKKIFSKDDQTEPVQDNGLNKYLIAFAIIFILSIAAWILTKNYAGGVITFLVLGIIVLNGLATKDDKKNNRGRFKDSDFE
jgi:hypothetical protein